MRNPFFIIKCLLSIVAVMTAAPVSPQPAQASDPAEITIFAAASTTNAVTEINALFESRGLGRTKVAFAASSTLAKQIDMGAPADIYLSANQKWMDFLAAKGMIATDSRFDLLGNRLVLIAPTNSQLGEITIVKGFALADLLGQGRLSMGDPAHVPAGIYGKQALASLGVWDAVASKTAPAKDVRTALMLVERGEAPLGLVYATDAAVSTRVRVLGMFPQTCHPAVSYPVAVIDGHQGRGPQRYLDFLKTPEARMIFEKFGFSVN
jgi:molybdate transport system substrate-binding protein